MAAPRSLWHAGVGAEERRVCPWTGWFDDLAGMLCYEPSEPLRALSGASRDLRKYTHQIWLAGLGAFARAEEQIVFRIGAVANAQHRSCISHVRGRARRRLRDAWTPR